MREARDGKTGNASLFKCTKLGTRSRIQSEHPQILREWGSGKRDLRPQTLGTNSPAVSAVVCGTAEEDCRARLTCSRGSAAGQCQAADGGATLRATEQGSDLTNPRRHRISILIISF